MILHCDSIRHDSGFRFSRPEGFPSHVLGVHTCGRKRRSILVEPPVTDEVPGNVLMLTEPGVGYAFEVIEPVEEIWYFLDPALTPRFFAAWTPIAPGAWVLPYGGSALTGEIIRAMLSSLADWQRGPEWRPLAVNALERVILLGDQVRLGHGAQPPDPRVQIAVDYIRTHLAEPMDVATLAAAATVSDSHLAHLFRDAMGQSPMRYLETLRMREAASLLLTTNRQIQEIAADVGYDNPFHFSQRFRAHHHRSPRAFRTAGGLLR